MGRLIASCMVSVDGVMESPDWSFPYWSDDLGDAALEELVEADVLLLGRVTYAGFVEYWPTVSDDTGMADRMNSIPKLVASRTLTSVSWNASLLNGDIPTRIAESKVGSQGDVLLLASADLLATLIRHTLVDEYRIRVVPVVVGRGKHLFSDNVNPTGLRLVSATTFERGVVSLVYQPG